MVKNDQKLVKIAFFGHFYQFLVIFDQKLAIFEQKTTKNEILHEISQNKLVTCVKTAIFHQKVPKNGQNMAKIGQKWQFLVNFCQKMPIFGHFEWVFATP